ncbi:MAG TPA: CYTH domain-containing protein [Pseudomonadaceae bacterium]|nr:CYTH domain-containing protein [Pseudomonadaceae bacterium]
MVMEIERKFLVKNDEWRELCEGVLLRQGYLSSEKMRVVRVRIAGSSAFLTVKGKTSGVSRLEFEYPIPVEDAGKMLDELCEKPLVEKTRYILDDSGHRWEIDEFHGVNQGLIVAEIELDDENDAFVKPSWLGGEVSHDPRYFNANLAAHPYSEWQCPE